LKTKAHDFISGQIIESARNICQRRVADQKLALEQSIGDS